MARCRIWCLLTPDGLPVLYAYRLACAAQPPETGLCIRHTSKGYYSTRVSLKDINKQSLNFSLALRKMFSSMATEETQKNKIIIHTSKHICKCDNSRNYTGLNQGFPLRHFSVYTAKCKDKHDYDVAINSDPEDQHIKPALDSFTPSASPPNFVEIVPGKGPPPEPPIDCCMSGCANCVWIQYAEELKRYYSLNEGSERAKKAIEEIDNPGLQMFLKLELGLL